MRHTQYRFILEPYKTPASRHTCPSCGKHKEFTRYIDTQGETVFPDHVGKCNREINCGYHYTPGNYFDATGRTSEPNRATNTPPVKLHPSYVPAGIMAGSLSKYDQNNFAKFLFSRFGRETVVPVLDRYKLGTAAHWPGATVFWQVDSKGNVRAGKIMLYNPETGKRVKDEYKKPNWAHRVHKDLKGKKFILSQCLFGEHLLNEFPGVAVGIVESEKTAILASLYFQGSNMVWMATGTIGFPEIGRFEPLKGRKIVLFPDTGIPKKSTEKTPFERWSQKAIELSRAGFVVSVSNLLERAATREQRQAGADLADYLLEYPLSDFTPKPKQNSATRPQEAPQQPTAPQPEQSKVLPPGYRFERYTDKAGNQVETLINADGYPAAWDVEPMAKAALTRATQSNPVVTSAICRLGLTFDGVFALDDAEAQEWKAKQERRRAWYPAPSHDRTRQPAPAG